jgi:hypothetical protein
VVGRKRDNLLTPNDEEWVRGHKQRVSPLLDHDAEGCLKIGQALNKCSESKTRLGTEAPE